MFALVEIVLKTMVPASALAPRLATPAASAPAVTILKIEDRMLFCVRATPGPHPLSCRASTKHGHRQMLSPNWHTCNPLA